jgi:hypothetical protein
MEKKNNEKKTKTKKKKKENDMSRPGSMSHQRHVGS